MKTEIAKRPLSANIKGGVNRSLNLPTLQPNTKKVEA